MIITLKGADFSSINIGSLSSWTVSRVLGTGAAYSGVSSVDKGASFSATVTIAEGYELGSAGVTVTMGGVTQSSAYSISGNTITINIGSVTGNVVIRVSTKNTSSGEEDSGESGGYTLTINPTPSTATVTLAAAGYSLVSGTGSQSISVSSGTLVTYMVSTSGYVTQNDAITVTAATSKNISLTAYGDSGTTIPLVWYPQEYYFSAIGSQSYSSTQGTPLNRSTSSNANTSNHKNFWATQLFTKENLPNGSIITVTSGYQYRPDGAKDMLTANTASARPANVTTASVIVDDSWWGDFPIRGFNISSTSSSDLSSLSESDMNGIFSITLP